MAPLADDEMAEGEASDPLADVEASAWADIKASLMEGGNDSAGQAAMKDFIVACVKRELAKGYPEKK